MLNMPEKIDATRVAAVYLDSVTSSKSDAYARGWNACLTQSLDALEAAQKRIAELEASQPVVPELGYFAFWPDNGEEVFKKKEDAIAFCQEAIDLYREDAADEGWGGEVRQVYWGVVAQRATEIEVSNEGHVDYVLAPALQEG